MSRLLGEYVEAAGMNRRAAVSPGPEFGTVGPELVKEAAKEALRGVGFDRLIVCGFTFDSYVGETAKEFSPARTVEKGAFAVAEQSREFGNLQVLLARINPDLGDG